MEKLPDDNTVHFELPAVAIPGCDATVFEQMRKARTHAIYLDMQFYALAVLDMFEDLQGMDSIGVTLSGDGDGFIYLNEPEFEDGDDRDLSGDIEKWGEVLNDMRDNSMVGFIEGLCGDEAWCRDTMEDTIATAYNQVAANDMVPTWEQVSERRRGEITARALDASTPTQQTPVTRPRM